MNFVLLALRLLHILGGIFWVGGALAMAFFITPTIMATAEAGQKFMGHLMTQTKFSRMMTIAAFSAVIAGTILYWIDSDGFTSAWMTAGPGVGFGVGGFFALIGLGAGLMIPRGGAAMAKLAAQFKGAPTPEQKAQMAALVKRQKMISAVNAHSLLAASILMAVARYLRF
jgi:uncharacterized membrane protein